MKRKEYSAEEDQFLIDSLNKRTWIECAAILKRHKSSVYGRVARLKLKHSPEFLAEHFRQKQTAAFRSNSFQPGHKPWNKGTKGLIASTPAMKNTQFKAGHEPANTKYDGFISVRLDKRSGKRYKWIRTSKNKWELYHRYMYRKHIGPIQKGMNVSFKDGDSLNCNPSNLVLISKRQNMDNNTIHRFPMEVKQLIRTQAKFNQQIQKHATQ